MNVTMRTEIPYDSPGPAAVLMGAQALLRSGTELGLDLSDVSSTLTDVAEDGTVSLTERWVTTRGRTR